MYKDLHNKIQNLPQGTPAKQWVNLMWLLVFSPYIVMFLGLVGIGIWTIGEALYKALLG